ncbi:hypothetical protein CC2G_000377 [Coprinopsis cinerea AmutBmut pab1-1]|nr:hypothetical protein CC2G_000377 [Coprinopsis cinerea AmutBmut pab1-1]
MLLDAPGYPRDSLVAGCRQHTLALEVPSRFPLDINGSLQKDVRISKLGQICEPFERSMTLRLSISKMRECTLWLRKNQRTCFNVWLPSVLAESDDDDESLFAPCPSNDHPPHRDLQQFDVLGTRSFGLVQRG